MINNGEVDMLAQFELVITHVFTADNLADASGDRVLMQQHFEQEIQMAFAEWDIDIQFDKSINHSNAHHHSFIGCLQRRFAHVDELNQTNARGRDSVKPACFDNQLSEMKFEVSQCCAMITDEATLVSFKLLGNK